MEVVPCLRVAFAEGLVRQVWDIIQAILDKCSLVGDLARFVVESLRRLVKCKKDAISDVATKFVEILKSLLSNLISGLIKALTGVDVAAAVALMFCEVREAVKAIIVKIAKKLFEILKNFVGRAWHCLRCEHRRRARCRCYGIPWRLKRRRVQNVPLPAGCRVFA